MELQAKGFGSQKEVIAELVLNTSMVGYQEILSDPSYTEQIVVMTYPLIGNYGIIDEDYESKLIGPKGFIVREYNDKPSNFRYTKTLNELLEENEVPGLTHLDTRKLTRILRDEGAMLGLVCDPIAGLVEVPCVKRNAAGAMIAMSSADMALAGIRSAVPPDEVILAMREVGDKMDVSLKETGIGGVAGTPFGQKIAEKMEMG